MPELGSGASSERACRLWAARHSQGKRPAHWAPSRCLGCSSQPLQKSPIALPLAIQVDHRYHRHRRGRALGGRPDSAEVLRLPVEKEEENSQGGKGKGRQGGLGLELARCTASTPPVWCLGPHVATLTFLTVPLIPSVQTCSRLRAPTHDRQLLSAAVTSGIASSCVGCGHFRNRQHLCRLR